MSENNQLVDVSKVLSAEDIAFYNDLAKQNSDVQPKRLPILKINYEDTSKYPVGSWVLGQQKKDSKVVEEGIAVNKFIILKVRNLFNMYDESDTSKNCHSPIHKDFENVYGSNYKFKCGKTTCKHKAEGSCKASKVVFGIAVTPEGEKKDCILYIRGVNYMPFLDYIRDVTKVEIEMEGKKVITNVPLYSVVNNLASRADKKGTVKFFHAEFSRFQILKRNAVEKLKEQVDQLEKDLERDNTDAPEADA